MQNQTPTPQSEHAGLIVVSTLFLAVSFYFTFILGNIAKSIVWFGAAFAMFIIANNSKE